MCLNDFAVAQFLHKLPAMLSEQYRCKHMHLHYAALQCFKRVFPQVPLQKVGKCKRMEY